ncbi:pancreatic lipase-related protein 2-like [Anopheles aquasalis]|uniref:pancreatic lipase-related protein 2-like n=1 Tax=Anopheles aquasalis TaxID=42839 RepID=UPI00215A1657|nr:pancreatic lipase-related protein 2-like [Anopheles aquasalis]
MKTCSVVLVALAGALVAGEQALAAAAAGEAACAGDRIAIPKDTESFECWTEQQIQAVQQSEALKRLNVDKQVKFLLWTQQTENGTYERLTIGELATLQNASFNPANPTRILIHGWMNDWTSDAVHGLAQTYTAKGAYNVIGIDWCEAGGCSSNYITARIRVTDVAVTIAKEIALLLEAGQHPNQIVVIGHSLGAHVAGMTAKHFARSTPLAGVIALDPAGPLFLLGKPQERVDSTDAQYVEVIHTNTGRLGHADALGQADFYPNGGHEQPGCVESQCSHRRAIVYLKQSLESPTPLYLGRGCESNVIDETCDGAIAVMGGDLNDRFKRSSHGLFYLSIKE